MNKFANLPTDPRLGPVKRLSASQINAFADDQAAWFLNRFVKPRVPDPMPGAHRGDAVEAAICHILQYQKENRTTQVPDVIRRKALVAGQKEYARQAAYSKTPMKARDVPKDDEFMQKQYEKSVQEQADIPAFLDQLLLGVREVVGRKQVKDMQVLASANLHGYPVAGFIDLQFPGLTIDLKTTRRITSEFSLEHQRQGSIYGKCFPKNKVVFIYASPKKYAIHEMLPAEIREGWLDCLALVPKMVAWINLAQADQMLVRQLLTPNFSHWKWSNPHMVEFASEYYWGFDEQL